jgi:hypothetical protein
MNVQTAWIVLIALIWSSLPAQAQVRSGPTTSVELPKEVFWTDEAQEILGAKIRSADVVGALAKIIADFRNDPLHAAPAADALVRAVNDGFDTAAIVAELRKGQSVQDESGSRNLPADWKYGSLANRVDLTGFLYARQKTLAASDANAAVQYARAGLLLAILENDVSGPIYGLAPTEGNSRRDLLISDEQAKRLEKLAKDYRSSTETQQRAVILFRKSLFELASTPPGKLPDAKVKDALKAAVEARQSIVSRNWDLRLIHCVWQLLNVAHERKDADAVKEIEAFFSDWATVAKGSALEIWIDQAVKVRGPALHVPSKAKGQ